MNILIKLILAMTTIVSLGAPAFAVAASPHATGTTIAYYSMRGKFLFFNHISRRTLLQSIIQSDPAWQDREIV